MTYQKIMAGLRELMKKYKQATTEKERQKIVKKISAKLKLLKK